MNWSVSWARDTASTVKKAIDWGVLGAAASKLRPARVVTIEALFGSSHSVGRAA